MTDSDSPRPRWVWLLAAGVVTAVSLVAIERAAGLALVCPAIAPAPASCFSASRDVVAVVAVAVVVVLFAATVVAALVPRGARVVRRLVVALGLACTMGPLLTLSASGFLVDGQVWAIVWASALCAVVTLAAVVIPAWAGRARRPGRGARQ